MPTDDDQEPEWRQKQKEYEIKKARAKALKMRMTCTICGEKAKLNCPCGTTQYCTVACQKVDWRERGHRKACKKIRDERAAEAARAEAPTPPPSPPREVVYGPAPRSQADEIRARIAAEHEAARARREANPEPEMESVRYGRCCPICMEVWDFNEPVRMYTCCVRKVCMSCANKIDPKEICALCQTPYPKNNQEILAWLRRHVNNDVPEAVKFLGDMYRQGDNGLLKSEKKAAKIYKRAVELGDIDAMVSLGNLYVSRDPKKAMQLYRLAGADRGSARAQYNLGITLESAAGDLEESLRYYKLSANQGFADAERELGRRWELGNGCARDVDEAARWYKRAAAKGHSMAIQDLVDLAKLHGPSL